tara:strand:+ start:180 stop:512 length:333 start_codon:yes stop_codon:yes gene_type:complete
MALQHYRIKPHGLLHVSLNVPVILLNNSIHVLILPEAQSFSQSLRLIKIRLALVYAGVLFLLTTFCTTTGVTTPQQWHNRLLVSRLSGIVILISFPKTIFIFFLSLLHFS